METEKKIFTTILYSVMSKNKIFLSYHKGYLIRISLEKIINKIQHLMFNIDNYRHSHIFCLFLNQLNRVIPN